MDDSKKRKVRGGKKIDSWTVTIDGRDLDVEVYLTKVKENSWRDDGPKAGQSMFTAINDEFGIREESLDLNALQSHVEAMLKERATVTWERKLLVSVRGSRFAKDPRGWYDPEAARKDGSIHRGEWTLERALFAGSSGHTLQSSRDLKLDVKGIEVATIGGKKKWRDMTAPGYNREREIHDGWPEVGSILPYSHTASSPPERIVSMVPDTKENRDGLTQIFAAMEALVEKLDALLHPDTIQRTLLRTLGAKVGLLPAVQNLEPPAQTSIISYDDV